jgi:hypothetical protein
MTSATQPTINAISSIVTQAATPNASLCSEIIKLYASGNSPLNGTFQSFSGSFGSAPHFRTKRSR